MNNASEILQPLADFLKKELQSELITQGHKATGELINSIEVTVNDITSGFEIIGSSIYYGGYVESGRKKGAKGVPISALMDWIGAKKIQIKGMNDKSIAFMFQASIKRKGIKPSMFVENVLEKYSSRIESDIERYMYMYSIGIIENLITKTVKSI